MARGIAVKLSSRSHVTSHCGVRETTESSPPPFARGVIHQGGRYVTAKVLDLDSLKKCLSVRDLTDPAQGSHAMQIVLTRLVDSLSTHWQSAVRWSRESPIVSIED